MHRGYLLYLEDILASAVKILRYAKDISYENLLNKDKLPALETQIKTIIAEEEKES